MKKIIYTVLFLLLATCMILCHTAIATNADAETTTGEQLWGQLTLTLNDTVYVTNPATYFHISNDCPELGNAEASISTINGAIGIGAGLCQTCRAGLGASGLSAQVYLPTLNWPFNQTAYSSNEDTHYHLTATCPSFIGSDVTPTTIGEAVYWGKGYCSECFFPNTVPEATVEPVVEGVHNPLGEDYPLDMTVYIPETIPENNFGFGDIHVDPDCTLAQNTKLVTTTLEEALAQELEPCMSCTYKPAMEENSEDTDGFRFFYLGFSPEDKVYVPDGQDTFYFHFDARCTRLSDFTVKETTIADAMKNHGACDPCELCMPALSNSITTSNDGFPISVASGEMLVYYTPNGVYYHIKSDCSGMRNAELHTVEHLSKANKRHCPVCVGENASRFWLAVPQNSDDKVYFNAYNNYYHRSFECFNMVSVSEGTLGEIANGYNGFSPCPVCLPELSGGPSGERCWTTSGDTFYHATSDCRKIAGADVSEMFAVEAQAAGKLRCHMCVDKAALPEYAELFTAAFGSGLNNVYDGFIFERADPASDGRIIWYVSTAADASPNIYRGCTLTLNNEKNKVMSISLGGSFFSVGSMDRDFLKNLPESIRALCGEDAVQSIMNAMQSPDESLAKDYARNITGITLYFDENSEMIACDINYEHDFSSICLSWRVLNGVHELYNVQPLGEGWK